MINTIKDDSEKKMLKTLESLEHELTKIRTGRANASFLDHVQVNYYGDNVSLNQVASVTSSDSRTLMVTPWESHMTAVIEKAILNAGLGLNPATVGNSIKVPMPALTEERRKELIKVVRNESEQFRILIRKIRRDANDYCKNLVKNKTLSEDDERRINDIIQKMTDKYIINIDQMLSVKEKDLML